MRPTASGLGRQGSLIAAREWREPWLIAALLAPLVLLPLLIGQRLGEPVADDFDYLHHVLFSPAWSWFDGCGSTLYWRPIGRQLFYSTLAPLMLEHPQAVAFVQMGCLCIAAALLYRAFRSVLGPGAAFAVSTAPWMMESSRILVAWPSCFQDVGALLFVSLALHEAVAGRLWSVLAAGLAALLCKEVAAIALVTLVACPAVQLESEGRRRTWSLSIGLLVVAWAVLYLSVYARAALAFPGSGAVSWSWITWTRGVAFVPWWSFKAIWSLPASGGPVEVLVAVGLAALIPWSRVARGLRSRRPELRAWWTWGLLWSVPLTLTLVPFYPAWSPYRLAFVGLGILAATIATLDAMHRAALPGFILLRLGLLAIAPGPVREVAMQPPFRGASIDVPQLSRLQRFVADVRHELRSRHPTLPHGSTVVWETFPPMTEYAFGAQSALHVWYRDTTLKWVPISRWKEDHLEPAATIVEYQDNQNPSAALVEPEAMRALVRATDALNSGREDECIVWLSRADSLQADNRARVFRRSIAGKRSYALANLSFRQGRYVEARAHLLTLLSILPGDVPSRRMLERIEELAAEPRRVR